MVNDAPLSSPPTVVSKKALAISLISGGMGGFCVVLVGYPFDLLKVRMQTTSARHVSLTEVFRGVWQHAGWRGLYQGATAPFFAVTPIFAANFYGYELGKRLYTRLRGDKDSTIARCAFGGAFSAVQTSLIVIPAERVKVYMQIAPPSGREKVVSQNAIAVALRLVADGGVRALYRGAAATLMRDVPGLIVFFTVYEQIKTYLQPRNTTAPQIAGVTVAGGIAGIASWLVSLPSDVLKSRVQAAIGPENALVRARFLTLVVLKDLLRKEGPGALYRGLAPVLLRAFPANAACFLGVELCKEGLERAFPD